ncbi:FERM and PDZ domain-containing protein 1 isoform X2 [Pelobates fuscus]|uniref:FERM and PDZ domain-containing protein 1 isoform X2 n=1 Tax=Pelobates fuscus TaxID=191477 RepID=UPI002FE4B624
MEDSETHLLQTRKGHRIEQMVVRWLRRSRDNSSRGRVSTGESPPGGPNQFGCSLTLTLVIEKDLFLHNYGFDISRKPPLTVIAVTAGSPAEGKLLPGDQILRINNEDVENISVEKAANMVRESGDSIKMTVLRNTSSPKSSFLTAEKRARLRSNPVKVRFAEEVIVNGHTQGNSLLFMPNVLKVYLENGQTKAFKFEKKTTVKDIIMTLKEKLSINIIEHFALALEEQYNISKLFLLHEDELIEQVVQKRESHDYRCLLRVCFVPRDPLSLLQEDPVAFEYLYLQSCSDVLQERFAVEMKCSVALRLAALHIQERIHSCGQSQKISFKYIEKDWGIDNFLSPTLLRNMRGKDIKKAISFHIKRNQYILEPRQKQPISATQLRIQYLKLLGDLKTYGGKIFNATLMLQDRESHVTLLVGAKYGISQIINNKLNIMTTLAEFASISKIELNPESEKVSLVKVYLQDIKPISLLLESNNAKDIACLISGYCKLFVDPGANIFTWPRNSQVHRVSTEEGYESRACSDSEESSDVDSSLELLSERHFLKYKDIKPLQEEEEEDTEEEGIQELKQDNEKKDCDDSERKGCDGGNNDTDSISDASDSANTESQGYKISWSSDSIDALEEDDLETCSSSRPEFFQFYSPVLKNMGPKSSSNRGENIFYYPDIAESYDSNRSMEKNIKPKNSRRPTKLSRKRRSFLQTDYTAQVTYPLSPSSSSEAMDHVCCYEKESHMSSGSHSQTVSSLKDIEGEPALLEMKPLIKHKSILKTKRKTHSPTLMEMEPDTMEIKSVTDTVASSISAIRFRSDSGAEEKEQIGVVFQDGPNNGEHTPHWSTVEHSGRASPSQISLQMENISEHSDLCPELICDINSISLLKEANILDDIEPEIKAAFTNIFENVSLSTDTSTYLGSNCSSDLKGRKSLYVAEEPIPFMKPTIKNDSPQCDGNIERLTSPKNDNPNQSPSNNSKSKKLFDFSHATDLLFDFKGITDMLTSLPINSFKVGSTSPVSNGQNMPPCEEKEHLLKYTSESDVEDLDVVDVKRNRFLSSSPNSSKAAQVTFELSSDENGDEKEHGDLLLSSNTHTIKHNIYESSHKDYSNNLDEHSLKNGSCSLHNLEPKSPEIPKVGNLGNCSCQLSYTSCFRGVNVDVDDEIVDSEATISSLPRTLPPVSGNTLFTEKNHFAITNGTSSSMVGETLHLLRVRIGNSPSGYSMLQDSVLDLQTIIQDFKKESRVHPPDKCAKVFSEQKTCLCNVSRKMMTTSQKILRSDQSSDEMYQVAEETFFDLMEMTEVCLQFSSCAQCFKRHLDVHTNLRDLICTYNQFIQAIKKASDNENRDLYFKLLSRQCTALTAAAFCLTQHYRTVLSL